MHTVSNMRVWYAAAVTAAAVRGDNAAAVSAVALPPPAAAAVVTFSPHFASLFPSDVASNSAFLGSLP